MAKHGHQLRAEMSAAAAAGETTMNYRLESISIHALKSDDLRHEAEIQAKYGNTYPEAYRVHLADGQVLEAVHYTALDIVVVEHDMYDAKTIHEAIPQALAAMEPETWSLEA